MCIDSPLTKFISEFNYKRACDYHDKCLQSFRRIPFRCGPQILCDFSLVIRCAVCAFRFLSVIWFWFVSFVIGTRVLIWTYNFWIACTIDFAHGIWLLCNPSVCMWKREWVRSHRVYCMALPPTQTPIDFDDCSFVRIYGFEWVAERVYVWHEKDLNKTKLRFIVQFLHIYSLAHFYLFTRFLSRHRQHQHAMFIFIRNNNDQHGKQHQQQEWGKVLHSPWVQEKLNQNSIDFFIERFLSVYAIFALDFRFILGFFCEYNNESVGTRRPSLFAQNIYNWNTSDVLISKFNKQTIVHISDTYVPVNVYVI